MPRFAIYGTGGFGREILPIARGHLATLSDEVPELVFVDDDTQGDQLFGVPVLPFDSLAPGDLYVVAVGSGRVREALDQRCRDRGLIAMNLYASSYVQGDGVEIGEGAVFCASTMVTTSARIGRHFQCNIYSYIAHDCVIGDYVTFAPKVCCNGNVNIGDHAYIGTGAILRQGTPDKPLSIGAGAVVGMGAVVTRDVPPGETVVGNPARPLTKKG